MSVCNGARWQVRTAASAQMAPHKVTTSTHHVHRFPNMAYRHSLPRARLYASLYRRLTPRPGRQRHDVNCSTCLSHPSQQLLQQHRPHLNQRAYHPHQNRAALLKMLTLLAAITHISILTILDFNPIELVLRTPPSLVLNTE